MLTHMYTKVLHKLISWKGREQRSEREIQRIFYFTYVYTFLSFMVVGFCIFRFFLYSLLYARISFYKISRTAYTELPWERGREISRKPTRGFHYFFILKRKVYLWQCKLSAFTLILFYILSINTEGHSTICFFIYIYTYEGIFKVPSGTRRYKAYQRCNDAHPNLTM
jgi:hypothetical protein